jgi:hypothetical protein
MLRCLQTVIGCGYHRTVSSARGTAPADALQAGWLYREAGAQEGGRFRTDVWANTLGGGLTGRELPSGKWEWQGANFAIPHENVGNC